MDTPTRKTQLKVVHNPPHYVFTVFNTDRSAHNRNRQIATGVAESLEEAVELAEDGALQYLSDEIERVTVPFWVEETILTYNGR
jgi:hypothetical protein